MQLNIMFIHLFDANVIISIDNKYDASSVITLTLIYF